MNLFEVLDSPYPWKYVEQHSDHWVFPGTTYATFNGQSGKYTVLLSKHDDDDDTTAYDVIFYAADQDDSEGILGTGTGSTQRGGDAFKVFATVAAVLEDFAYNHDDVIYYIDAKEESRMKLYKRFLSYVKRKHGWPTEEYGNHFIIHTYK